MPIRTPKPGWLPLLLLQATALALCGCFQWQYNLTEGGVSFSKARIEGNGLLIGMLREDTLIGGRPCKKGWVHLLPSGIPVGFTASRDIDLGRFTIPADTWVFQNKDGVVAVCAFPRDTEVQGHLCRGTGGPEGAQASFYPDGALKQFFLRRNTRIQGIPCQAGVFNQSIMLHENGRLKCCVVSEDLVRDGISYPKGTRLQFDPDGRIAP